MNSKQNIGKIGENLACEYLAENGYKILTRNYRKKTGEIDIIAQAKNKTIVFVEVKALSSHQFVGFKNEESLMPEDHLTRGKLGRLKKTCQIMVAKNPDIIDRKRGWRIDLVAIDIGPGTTAGKSIKNVAIRHYENIF